MRSLAQRARASFNRFAEWQISGGLVLMAAAALGMVLANSGLAQTYYQLFHTKIGGLDLLHWINDGLMALFFLVVGLEIKREMVGGELDSWPRRALPLIAAVGGMIVPAVIFLAINWHMPENIRGWAVPTATDIAFALGVLALFGSRVSYPLKVFLTSLAIMDDLGAILIIAIFYASDFSISAFGLAVLIAATLFALNWYGVKRLAPYLVLGALLWVCMLFSGIHATLAGVVLAMTIPITSDDNQQDGDGSPLHRLEHGLGPWVTFVILPIFGFANAGVPLGNVSFDTLTEPLPLGIIAGLFFGKQIGIMCSVLLARRTGLAQLPSGASWRQVYGVAILCGIGFTMSLFIASLAYEQGATTWYGLERLGILAGSLVAGVMGLLRLKSVYRKAGPN